MDLPIWQQCNRACRCVDSSRSGPRSSPSSSTRSNSLSPRSLSIRSPVTGVEPFTTSPPPPPPPSGGFRPLEVAQRRPLECQPHRLNWANSHLPLHLRLYANRCESIYDCRDNLMTPREVPTLLDQGIWEQCERECMCVEQPPPGPRLGTRPSVPASNPASGHHSHSLSIRATPKKSNNSQRPPRPPRGPQRPQAPQAPQTLQYSRVVEGILRCKPHKIDWQSSYLRFATVRCEEISQCVGLNMVQIRGSFDAEIWRQCVSLCECKPQAPVEPYPLHMAPDPSLPPFHALGPSSHLLGPRSPAPESEGPSSSLPALAIRAPASLASTGNSQPFQNDRPRRLFAAQAPAPALAVSPLPPAQRWSLECAPHSLDWQRSTLRVRAERCGDIFSCFGNEMTQVRGDYDGLIQQQCERDCSCRVSDGEAGDGGAGAGAGKQRRGRGEKGRGRGRGRGLGSPVQGVS